MCATLYTHPSTPPFGVMPRTRKLNCAAEWNQFAFSNESRFNLSSYDNRVRMWRPRGENASILPLLYCDGMGRHCLQYTVTSSIDP
ncbi:hypothetical protein TNCV_3084301 [Trichonephila clavipes]|nr:hypothetical protein TNCV_3084301 [Trichonephila clavipes]